jgi:diketogulonate reductase-like aldo/keto reductase
VAVGDRIQGWLVKAGLALGSYAAFKLVGEQQATSGDARRFSARPGMPHELRGEPLTRRAVLRLMVAAAARPGRAGAAPSILERPIPSTGERIPAVGLGTWRTFDVGASAADRAPLQEVLQRFVGLGGRVVDSSPMYGAAESVVGDLAAHLAVTDKLFLATKVWTSGRDAGVAQMEASLRRLRARRLDLMQIHNLLDWRTHLRTLRDWKQAGRIRYLGVTHYTASAYDELEGVLRSEPLDFVQVNYSLGEREAERRILPLARDRGIAVLVNRPFSAGGLFQRVRGQTLPIWAAEIDCESWAQFFLKWILAHPAVSCVIPGTSRPQHVVDNMKAGIGRLPDPAARERMAALVAAG